MLSSIPTLTSNLITLQQSHFHKTNTFSIKPFSRNNHICFSISPSNQSEESRWIREESRWLREEQRWLREETRWSVEREKLLREIDGLKLRIQELERFGSVQGVSVSETVASIAKLLQVVKEGDLGKNVNRIAESGLSASPLVVDAAVKEEEIVVKEIISIPEKKEEEKKEMAKRRPSLRKGSEGDDVRALQEALQKLGFYSGEEDIEYSSFATGTERAVKTWQASLGVPEDGIVTAELQQRLFGGSSAVTLSSDEHEAAFLKKSENGAAVSSITDISEVVKKVVSEKGVKDIYNSEHRVFLLGENRWEDASRLTSSKRPVAKDASGNAITKCLTCRGEGRLLCMECDGTGEPNIEEQFMEWVEEGQKCPYCEGLGHVTCDLCGGVK